MQDGDPIKQSYQKLYNYCYYNSVNSNRKDIYYLRLIYVLYVLYTCTVYYIIYHNKVHYVDSIKKPYWHKYIVDNINLNCFQLMSIFLHLLYLH